MIAKYDKLSALRILKEFDLTQIKVGQSIGSGDYVMYKIVPRKFHPEVGISTSGWVYGMGYDIDKDWSIDIFHKKDWDLKGKPTLNMGLSYRM